MPRELPEWVGKTADSAIPPRVRVRVFDRYGGVCQCGCGRKILAGEAWDCEDTIAIINGGERRESNLKPWLRAHHKVKTAQDVAVKSKTYRMRAKHLGVARKRGPKIKSRGFAKAPPQRRATSPVERRS